MAALVPLDQLRTEHIEELRANMRAAKMSETSVTQLHRIVSRALTMAERRGRIGINPAGRLDAPTPAHYSPSVLSMDDARRLIQAASAAPDGARWIVALALGLRQGERLSLVWPDMKLNTGKVWITRELYRLPDKHGCAEVKNAPSGGRRTHWCPAKHSGGIFYRPPKTEAGKRHLALPAQIVDVITAHKDRQDLARLQTGDSWRGFTSANGELVDLVFYQDNGRSVDSRKDWGDWKKFLEQADVPSLRMQDARHTAATVLLRLMGVDGRVVMEMIGWSQSSMLKRYQHVLTKMKKDAAAKMSDALWAPPAPGHSRTGRCLCGGLRCSARRAGHETRLTPTKSPTKAKKAAGQKPSKGLLTCGLTCRATRT
ncbi:tyrosine-type recombinase/integrase [Arthrobacter sp. HY1533]|uniref:tyrosine-type recombinase/integrase n=1 Tax=Arthrobacter sp. HY1533 TaxID=2970919 RepID=UPI0022B9D4EC|nr:tyrosine-type recombinase/integrase [Arthrobacter sp. HY1533]